MSVHVSRAGLEATCGSRRWVELMLAAVPYESVETLHAAADAAFDALDEADWLEAFAHHPRLGDVESLRARFAASGAFSEREQAGMASTDEALLRALHRGNEEYERRNGFVFLVRAAGRSAQELLEHQRERLCNERPHELQVAAGQQREITHLRLDAQLQAVD